MLYKIYFADAGVAATGLTPTIDKLAKAVDGTDIESKPDVGEINATTCPGWYSFSCAPAEDLVGRVDGGATLTDIDRYVAIDITAGDGDLSLIKDDAGAIKTQTDKMSFVESNISATIAGEEVDVGLVKGVAVSDIDDFKADVLDMATETNASLNRDTVLDAVGGVDGKVDSLPVSTVTALYNSLVLGTLTYRDVLKEIWSNAGGRVVKNTETNYWDFYDFDNVTVLFSIDPAPTGREVIRG